MWDLFISHLIKPRCLLVACQASFEIMSRGSLTDGDEPGVCVFNVCVCAFLCEGCSEHQKRTTVQKLFGSELCFCCFSSIIYRPSAKT